jgi:alpha-glucosidase
VRTGSPKRRAADLSARRIGDKGRDGCRTPLPWAADAHAAGFTTGRPWRPCDPAHRALAIDRQQADTASTLNLTRRLLAMCRAHPALRLGRFELRHADDALLVFERRHDSDAVLAAFNFGPDEHVVDVGPAESSDTFKLNGARRDGRRLVLPPGAALVQRLQP